jgi:hypothetical protein
MLQGTVGDLSKTQADLDKPTSHALSTAKDIAGVAWSFTEMLLKRLPDAVDTNPAKIAFSIVKIVLQIKDVRRSSSLFFTPLPDYGYQEVKGNIDAVNQRILSTADQLRAVEEALAGWNPNNVEESNGMKVYQG